MAISNQGYRRDLNLQETTNDTVALDNLAGAGTADDISYLQNNLRNTSNVGFNKIDSNGFFSFAEDRLISASAISTEGDGTNTVITVTLTNPYLLKFGVEALPSGYLVFSPGGKVGEVGEAELVQPGQTEITHAYALTAQMFGFKILYLEAGSGASNQVDPNCIESANQVEGLCLIVGGGIRTGEQAAKAAQSGANWIVTGTLTEDASSMDELRQRIRTIVDSIQSSSS